MRTQVSHLHHVIVYIYIYVHKCAMTLKCVSKEIVFRCEIKYNEFFQCFFLLPHIYINTRTPDFLLAHFCGYGNIPSIIAPAWLWKCGMSNTKTELLGAYCSKLIPSLEIN